MNESDRKFWPFRPRTSIAWSIAILVGLLFVLTVLKKYGMWQISEKSDTAVLIGVVLVSLLPVVLAVLDTIIERGGVIEYGGVRIDFSQVPQMGMSGFTVPTNIGVPGQAVSDSSTTEILEALREATACEIVVIDLEEGQAWWETRLLVLLAGAVRFKNPEKVVFVGKDAGIDKRFQGWGYPSELLPCLLRAHSQYPMSYHKAMAAARQWELVEPLGAGILPPQPAWMQGGLVGQHPWMAFDHTNGLPNPLFAEQLLASDLGQKVEGSDEGPKKVSLVRLEELFRPVLHKENIDESWPAERQLSEFLNFESDYLAVLQNGKYSTLVSRLTVLNTIVKTLVEKK